MSVIKRGCMLLCGLTVLLVTNASAQVSLGAFGGMSRFTVQKEDVDPRVDLSSKNGLAIGALLNVGITSKVAVQAEPMFLHKGTIATIQNYGDVDVRASYIEVPVMLSVTLKTGSVAPYLMAGPSLGFLLSAKQTASFIPSTAEDIKDISDKYDFGLTGGAGVQFPLSSPVNGFVQGRYYHGTRDTHEQAAIHKSRGFKVVAGFSLAVTK